MVTSTKGCKMKTNGELGFTITHGATHRDSEYDYEATTATMGNAARVYDIRKRRLGYQETEDCAARGGGEYSTSAISSQQDAIRKWGELALALGWSVPACTRLTMELDEAVVGEVQS